MLALLESDERRHFRMGWSQWRRMHQAVAARCHLARQIRTHKTGRTVNATPQPRQVLVPLTDAQWDRVQLLLPPQRGRIGRPPHDHRIVLSGILSVVRNGSSWREIPTACGTWETAYTRYRLWQEIGRWRQILAVLDNEEPAVSYAGLPRLTDSSSRPRLDLGRR